MYAKRSHVRIGIVILATAMIVVINAYLGGGESVFD